ncbi:hypothetical protein HY489_06235 [Candidatus Woesearchaeota archaeon]|nr:hypothetical protein [Candidatus Woesearchaeota archaeon]
MEHQSKPLIVTILLGLSMITALLLETRMKTGAAIELVIIILGILAGALILLGLWIEEPWAYQLSSILFALSLANLIWIHLNTHYLLGVAFGILVNVSGIVMSITDFKKSYSVETYDDDLRDLKKELEALKKRKKRK